MGERGEGVVKPEEGGTSGTRNSGPDERVASVLIYAGQGGPCLLLSHSSFSFLSLLSLPYISLLIFLSPFLFHCLRGTATLRQRNR